MGGFSRSATVSLAPSPLNWSEPVNKAPTAVVLNSWPVEESAFGHRDALVSARARPQVAEIVEARIVGVKPREIRRSAEYVGAGAQSGEFVGIALRCRNEGFRVARVTEFVVETRTGLVDCVVGDRS
jgi:hypothetical protein